MKVETDFIAMLGLLAKAAAGNDINIGQFNRENVLRYADEQSVLPLVCSQLPELGGKRKNTPDGSEKYFRFGIYTLNFQ